MKNTHQDVHVNPEREGTDTVDHLRSALKRRSVKLTVLAERLGIPYRSLQNYFKRREMPLSIYERICATCGIPRSYPMDGCRMKLDHLALSESLLHILWSELPSFEFRTINGEEGLFKITPSEKNRSSNDLRRDASILATEVASTYDQEIELELGKPLDDAG